MILVNKLWYIYIVLYYKILLLSEKVSCKMLYIIVCEYYILQLCEILKECLKINII